MTIAAVREILNVFRMENDSYVYDIKDDFLDYRNSLSLELNCIALLNELNIYELMINFHNVQKLSTSGIGSLLSIFHCCNSTDTKFRLVNCSKEINEMFSKTFVNKVLEVN